MEGKIENKLIYSLYLITVKFFCSFGNIPNQKDTENRYSISKISVMAFMLVISLNLFLLPVV